MLSLSSKTPSYLPIPADEASQPSARKKRAKPFFCWMLAITLLLLNILAVFPILYRRWTVAQSAVAKPCGNTWQEAESAGCRYNIMMSAWLPPTCFDAPLTDEFKSVAPWQFWADVNRTQPLSIEEVSRRIVPTRASPEFFHAHCAFSFSKLQRAIEIGGEVEVELAKLERATLCQKFMMGRIPEPDGLTYEDMATGEIWFNVAFPRCISVKGLWS